MTPIPNLFILGAAKCGTTYLYHLLASHPRICMTIPKEPFFYEAEYPRGYEYYHRTYLIHWLGEPIIGDARHRNLLLPYIPARIARDSPYARLIILLRNPVDRAHSHWWHWHSRGVDPLPFEDAIALDLNRLSSSNPLEGPNAEAAWRRSLDTRTGWSPYRTYIDSGYYAPQIKRYLRHFELSQIRILTLEDLQQNPHFSYNSLLHFLGLAIDPHSDPQIHKHAVTNPAQRLSFPTYLKQRLPFASTLQARTPSFAVSTLRWLLTHFPTKSKPTLPRHTRQLLANHYAPWNSQLSRLLDRDLHSWT